jgi:hypothetical protein
MHARYSEQKSLYRKQQKQEREQLAAVHASEVQRAEEPVSRRCDKYFLHFASISFEAKTAHPNTA